MTIPAGPDKTPPARPGGPTAAERRVAAQKAALKANMARRKEQARARDDDAAQTVAAHTGAAKTGGRTAEE